MCNVPVMFCLEVEQCEVQSSARVDRTVRLEGIINELQKLDG